MLIEAEKSHDLPSVSQGPREAGGIIHPELLRPEKQRSP